MKVKNYKEVFAILLLLIVGFLFRFYGLNVNPSFWTDENQKAIFDRAILERDKPILAYGYTPGFYLPVLAMKFLGINQFAARFLLVIFGVLAIWAFYLLVKELFNGNVKFPV